MKTPALICEKISREIAEYLAIHLKTNRGFSARSFYGETFTLNLLKRNNLLDEDLFCLLTTLYEAKDKTDPEFHHEFNNYALSDYGHAFNCQQLKKIYLPLRFKGTTCTNWTLLRSCVRLKEQVDRDEALLQIKNKITNMQLASGLILDDRGVKSFQYHCFSAAMLSEINDSYPDETIKKAFLKAVDFIRLFILDNGEALYIGRGQEQSFGLGVLVYILARAYKQTLDETLIYEIQKVLDFILTFKREDGSFPLVFTGKEDLVPADVNMMDEKFLGWYPYNNYFDYLPFLGYFLHKSSVELDGVMNLNHKCNRKDYQDSSFIIVRKPEYEAVLSMPGGYWTNDLSLPLILHRGKFQTPILGGEQFQKSLYSIHDLSMPTTHLKKLSWRKYGRGIWFGRSLVWFSLFGIMKRSFVFKDNEIEVNNSAVAWVPSFGNFSFLDSFIQKDSNILESNEMAVHFSKPVTLIRNGYSASGKLKIVKGSLNITLKMEFLA